jgi:hypothetical protein
MEKSQSPQEKIFMKKIRRIFLLIFGYFSTILLETSLNVSSSILPPSIDGFLPRFSFMSCFVLFMLWLVIIRGSEAFEIPLTFFKFVELIPILIDLINLLFIYQYKMKE